MKLVVFGRTITSAAADGHAPHWRALARALGARGHAVTFFERDAPWRRDLHGELPGLDLVLYRDWAEVRPLARAHLHDADAALVTSSCPDGPLAAAEVLDSRALRRVFYDLDAPLPPTWLGADGLAGFDLVLGIAGGRTLDALRDRLGARRVAPLHACVDPALHAPAVPRGELAADLSSLGPCALPALERLLLEPARRRPDRRFLLAGDPPQDVPGPANVVLASVAAADHAALRASARLELVVVGTSWCPPARLFEAAASGAVVLTDDWDGLPRFFRPGEEVLVARTTEHVLEALDLPRRTLAQLGRAARDRALRDHTAARRAEELEVMLAASLEEPALAEAALEVDDEQQEAA